MNEAHSPLPWIPSQYMDTEEWGILNQQNEIMVGISSRLTKERAEFICRAVNTHASTSAALRHALQNMRYAQAHGIGQGGAIERAEKALRQAEEWK